MPLASARQHPKNQKENQAGHSSERTVEGQVRGESCVCFLINRGFPLFVASKCNGFAILHLVGAEPAALRIGRLSPPPLGFPDDERGRWPSSLVVNATRHLVAIGSIPNWQLGLGHHLGKENAEVPGLIPGEVGTCLTSLCEQ